MRDRPAVPSFQKAAQLAAASQPHPAGAAPPRGGSHEAGSGSGSSLVPTPPWPRGAERPLWAPHRTLQLPKPKRGALLSAGIWVVVKRLHGLVHELQCRLSSFHGGGGGGGSDGSRSSPRLLRLLRLRPSLLCRPQPLPDWRHLFFGRYQGRGVPGGSCPLGNRG